MGKPNAARSFLEQLADFDDPAPKDFDPEKHDVDQYDTDPESDKDGGSHQEEARNHYADTGKSELRTRDDIELGPRYGGANVSRIALQDGGVADDEDEPFGSDDGLGKFEDDESEMEEEEEQVNGSHNGSLDKNGLKRKNEEGHTVPKASLSPSSASSMEDSEDEDDDIDRESNSSSSSPPKEDREVLRRMMAEEQKSVAASLSATVKADIAKGNAIKQQRSTFDSLLNTRIKLQKALVATNSMDVAPEFTSSDSTSLVTDCASVSRAAEDAALNLLDSITALRNSIYPNGAERVLLPAAETSNEALWDRVTYFDNEAKTRRRATLTKWSQRTNPMTALQPQNRFSQTNSQQPLTSVIDQQLAGENMDRAIKRTRVARSCAPVQAASKAAVENESIYDDADFYSLLLRELVDRRMADTQSAAAAAPTLDMANIVPSRAELKVKKTVDTKASKGRKMRYVVHEKLQNFMAAEDRGSWGERQRAELFGSLLGRNVEMREVDGSDEEMEEDVAEVEAGGLRLFGR